MRRTLILGLALALYAAATTTHAAVVVPQNLAARYGLTRSWFTQIGSPQTTGAIHTISLDRGTLLVQTSRGMLNALQAETGRVLWSAQVGPPNHVSTEPAANEKFVAVVNGSVLYVLDRASGRVEWQKSLNGSPGAGPALSLTHVLVPMISGLVEAFDLEKGSKQQPWVYKSAGRLSLPPMVTGQSISWTTEKGYFYVASPEGLGIRYRLETRAAIHSRPGYWTPNLYACSSDGFVYAVNEASGKITWKFAAGDAIYTSPVAIENKVYITCELGGMYCLDAKTGSPLWIAPKISQFVSASPTRVYARDHLDRLAVIDGATGMRLGSMALKQPCLDLVNNQTDRIFLASPDAGVMQCLREITAATPVVYTPPAPVVAEVKVRGKSSQEKSTEKAGKPVAEDAADEGAMAEDADQPAMNDEKPEAPAEGDSEDPFK